MDGLSREAGGRWTEPCDRGGACRAQGPSSEWWDRGEQLGVPSPEVEVGPTGTEGPGDVGEPRTTGETTACAEMSTCKAPTQRPRTQVPEDGETRRTNQSHSESLRS